MSVASAHVELVPTFGGNGALTNAITRQLGGADTGAAGKLMGSRLVGGFKGAVSGLPGWLKGGAVMGAVSSITAKAMGTIASSMSSAVARADTLANFPRVMTSLGYSAQDAARSTEMMKGAVEGLPTRLQDMTGNVQMLAATMGNLASGEVNATSVGKAFNDMMLAGGQGTEAASQAFTQYTQMLAVGKVDQMAWNSVVRAAPGQVDALAKSMLGAEANQRDLYEAMRDGAVSFEDFNAAIVRLDKDGGDGFASFEQQARDATKGIGTSMANLRNSVSSQMAGVLGALNSNGEIAGIFDFLKERVNGAGSFIVEAISSMKASIDFGGFRDAFDGLGQVISDVFGSGGADASSFGAAVGSAINGAIPVIEAMREPLRVVAEGVRFLADHAQEAAPVVGALAGALAGMRVANALRGPLTAITTGVGGIATKALPAAGGLATMAGTTRAAGGAAAGSAKNIMALGAAVLAVGAGILLASAGMWVLASAAMMLAGGGDAACIAMLGMVAGVAVLAAVFAALGPALTAGAVGMLAFGAAVALVGVGVLLASSGISMLAGVLPQIAAFGQAAGMAAMVLGAGLLVAGAGALVAGVGMIVLAAGLAVASLAVVAAAAALAVLDLALAGAAAAVGALGDGAVNVGAGLMNAGTGIQMAGDSAGAAAWGLGQLAAAMWGAQGAIDACASGFGNLNAQVGAAGAAVASASGSMGALASAAAAAGSAVSSMGAASVAAVSSIAPAANTAASAFNNVGASASRNFAAAASAAASAAARIRASMRIPNYTARINVAAGYVVLPHFSMSGTFDPKSGAVPHVSVSWWAKGGIFTQPTIFANGVGEKGPEAVLPLSRLESMLESSYEGHAAGDTYNLYLDGMRVNDDAAIQVAMMNLLSELQRKGAMNRG